MVNPKEKARLDDFGSDLSNLYHWFHPDRFPRPLIADRLFEEWQSDDEKFADKSVFSNLDKPGLLFHGEPRTGKTMLACELVRRRIQRGQYAGIFLNMVEWATECVTKAKLCELHRWSRRLLRLSDDSCDKIVILDDIDKIRATASVQAELFNLIELATSNEVALIVTTNITSRLLADKFDASFGDAIVARLNEFCVPVNFSNKP